MSTLVFLLFPALSPCFCLSELKSRPSAGKTAGLPRPAWPGCHGALELLRRSITQRRVQAAAIVVLVDERLDVRAQVLEIPIIVGVDLFALERLHEALTTGIVVRIRRPAHARNHLVLSQHLHVFARRHTARRDRNDGPSLAAAVVSDGLLNAALVTASPGFAPAPSPLPCEKSHPE